MRATPVLPFLRPHFFSPDNRLSSPQTARTLRRRPLTCGRARRVPAQDFAEADLASYSASLYEILKVNQDASPTEIKTAYRSLAKLCHPDSLRQSGSDGRDFIEIHNAYETLSDPAARAVYDLSLESRRRRHFGCRSRFYRTRRWETDQCW